MMVSSASAVVFFRLLDLQ